MVHLLTLAPLLQPWCARRQTSSQFPWVITTATARTLLGLSPTLPMLVSLAGSITPNATGSPIWLAYAGDNPYDLRMGDFNGDGTTDVFAASPWGGGDYQWLFSPGGAANYVYLALTQFPVSVLNLGDFNGDNKTDVFSKLDVEGSNPEWHFWDNGLGSPSTLRITPDATPFLGSLNNDTITDAFQPRGAPPRQCSRNGPLLIRPWLRRIQITHCSLWT